MWDKREVAPSDIPTIQESPLGSAINEPSPIPETDSETESDEGNETMDFIPYGPILRKASPTYNTKSVVPYNDGPMDESDQEKSLLCSGCPLIATKARSMPDPNESPIRNYEAMCARRLKMIENHGLEDMAQSVQDLKDQMAKLSGKLDLLEPKMDVKKKIAEHEELLKVHGRSFSTSTTVLESINMKVNNQQHMLNDLKEDNILSTKLARENEVLKMETLLLKEKLSVYESREQSRVSCASARGSCSHPRSVSLSS
jgi:hypothetical protein